MFLAHFLGDVHQPLHCGSVQDYGGNTIAVSWYNRTMTNLHRVWDLDIIEKAMKDYYGNDLSIMTSVIMLNITVSTSKCFTALIICLACSASIHFSFRLVSSGD
jgi:hypothetical protein